MKSKILIISILGFALIILGSCSTPHYQGKLQCDLTMDEISEKVNQVLFEENFTLMPSSKYIISAKATGRDMLVGHHILGEIGITEKTITATATLTLTDNPNYWTLNDEADGDYIPYWRVRRKLEKICNNVMIITDIRKEQTSKPQNEDEDEFKK